MTSTHISEQGETATIIEAHGCSIRYITIKGNRYSGPLPECEEKSVVFDVIQSEIKVMCFEKHNACLILKPLIFFLSHAPRWSEMKMVCVRRNAPCAKTNRSQTGFSCVASFFLTPWGCNDNRGARVLDKIH